MMIISVLLGLILSLIILSISLRYKVEYIVSTVSALNVLFYVITAYPNLVYGPSISVIEQFGLSFESIAEGRYYCLFSSAFIHANLLHLLMNLYALYIFGGMVERVLGRKGVFSLYFTSMITSSIVSIFFLPRYAISIGASGAIFGLIGFYFWMLKKRENIGLIEVVALLFWIFGIGFINVNFYSHLSGLIVGIAYGSIIKERES